MTENTSIEKWTSFEIVSVIRELAARNDLPSHLVDVEISETDTVNSLGIDSIGGVYIIEKLEEMSGQLMPDDFLELNFSLEEVANRLNQLIENNNNGK